MNAFDVGIQGGLNRPGFCSDSDDHDVASCSRIIGDVLLFFRREIALFNSFAGRGNDVLASSFFLDCSGQD
ncbi:hypothetical protein D3C84_1245820 [compost metagenome]